MGATPLRLLVASAALAIAAALMPAMVADAAPQHTAGIAGQTVRDVATSTRRAAEPDVAAQGQPDADGLVADDPVPEPPVWLLGLLVPILLGGAIGIGIGLHRVR